MVVNKTLLQLLQQSPLFDPAWYLKRYPDVARSGLSPAMHYLLLGSKLQRDPGPDFSCSRYLAENPQAQRDNIFLCYLTGQGQVEASQPQSVPLPTVSIPLSTVSVPANKAVAVVFHAFHPELIATVTARLAQLPVPFDLYVTTPHAAELPQLQALITQYPAATVLQYPNQGRDIGPLIHLLPELQQYQLCLKVHTKKGLTQVAEKWCNLLLDGVVSSAAQAEQIINLFNDNADLAMAGTAPLLLSAQTTMFKNQQNVDHYARLMALSTLEDWGYFAGTMFWFRPAAFAPLLPYLAQMQFQPEQGLIDGGLEHALERLLGLIACRTGRIALIEPLPAADLSYRWYQSQFQLGLRVPSDFLPAYQPGCGLVPVQTTLHGDLNDSSHQQPVINGWLAAIGQPSVRQAMLWIDGQPAIEVDAAQFREDLQQHQINQGYHAFSAVVPLKYLDGRPHRVQLADKATGTLIKTRNMCWKVPRPYQDFIGFLAHSYTNPYIPAPFCEEDKACFAAMEGIADWLSQLGTATQPQPLVSVIMPCFNRIDTIASAVDSVLKQGYHNFELVLIDDGSSDGTLQWCQQQSDPRINLLVMQQNGGASAARNMGLQAAKGEIIAYLDSDNEWDRRYLAAMVGAFSQLPAAETLYSGQLIYRGQQLEPIAARFGAFNKSLLFNNNYIDMNAFCHTRATLQRLGGFDPAFKRFEDWDLFLRYATGSTMYSVPVLLSHYYQFKADNTLTAQGQYFNQLQLVRQKNAETDRRVELADSFQVLSAAPQQRSLQRKVSVVIPSYQALDDLRACVDSLLGLKLGPQLEIVIVDNASAAEVVEYIQQLTAQQLVLSICNKKNYGFTYAVNQGMQLADPAADILLLNNDALVTAGAIEVMQAAAFSLPDCALVVPQQVLPGGTETITIHVPFADPLHACDVNLSLHHANVINPPLFADGRYTEISFAAFFCVYLKRETYQRVGPLDAQYGRHYRSDRIYCELIRHVHRLKMYHVADAVVFHKLQRSTKSLQKQAGSAEFDLMFHKNQWDQGSQRELGFATARWDI